MLINVCGNTDIYFQDSLMSSVCFSIYLEKINVNVSTVNYKFNAYLY